MGEQDGKYFGGQLDLFHNFMELFFYLAGLISNSLILRTQAVKNCHVF